MAIKCEECGIVIPNDAKECPNCGCPVQGVNNTINVNYDDYDYSKFYSCHWILRPWYFSSNKDSEKENFDQLNDICLLSVIGLRIVLRAFLIAIVIQIANGLLSSMLLQGGLHYVSIVVTPLIGAVAFIAFIYYTLKGVEKYWVPFHRTFRRINKRYWISMHKAAKDNTISNI